MSNHKLTVLASTFFYCGYFPKAPGSFATLVGLGICYALKDHPVLYVLVFTLITIAGFFFSGKMEKEAQEKDPSCIVIDEVSGIMLSLFMLPMTAPVLWTGFFLFRAFDMFKIYPVNKFEPIPGGVGVMMDDVFAGIYTNLTLQIALRMAGYL